jgi:isopropylmalate/homocitrate/citramalate synthase
MEKNRIEICDVTLREGEQTPGVFFELSDKVKLAQELLNAGISNIEVGVIGIDSDERAYEEIRDSTTAGERNLSMTLLPVEGLFKRLLDVDIQAVNIVVPSTDVLAGAFGSDSKSLRDKVIRWIRDLQKRPQQLRIVLADASRALFLDKESGMPRAHKISEESLHNFSDCIDLFVAEGVKEFIIADTLGIFTPSDVSYLMNFLRQRHPSLQWGVHFHNDFGLACANSLTALECGAALIQTGFNGLGERSGIAATPEVVAALKYLYDIDLGIGIQRIRQIAKTVEYMTGIVINERAPVVGRGLYLYETATPILGMLKHGFQFFEPIVADDLGEERKLIIGKHTSARLHDELRERGILPKDTPHDMLKTQAATRREGYIAALRKIVEVYHELNEASLTAFPVQPSIAKKTS